MFAVLCIGVVRVVAASLAFAGVALLGGGMAQLGRDDPGRDGDANKRFLTKAVINGLLRLRARGLSPAVQQLLAHLVNQGYSREQEFRADRFAVALTNAAGFDPHGGCRLFRLLGKHDGDAASALGAYFSSHPSMADRIQRIEERIGPPA